MASVPQRDHDPRAAGALTRALEEKTRRLAAERLELAEQMERELADVRTTADERVAAQRERADRLEVELARTQAALIQLQRSKTQVLSAPLRRVYYRLRRR